ncbi:MAG: hypothetical protein WBG02_01465 [Candidatus Acidiferrum sp.]
MSIVESIVGGIATAAGKKVIDAATRGQRKRGKGKAGRTAADALEAAMRKSAAKSNDQALQDFREDLFAELTKMIKPAIVQAKKGKPALLRILTRYGK